MCIRDRTDTIAIQLNIDVAQKQKILETADVKERMKASLGVINR